MQTQNKKRKIQESPVAEEDDWGVDFTAEEFDFLQSQVVDAVENQERRLSQNNQQQEIDDKHALQGEIHMLRQSLDQKNAELEKIRTEQSRLASAHLKELQDAENKHLLTIDRLNSSLMFKEHELSTEQAKIKSLENKLKLSSIATELGNKNSHRPSPVKVIAEKPRVHRSCAPATVHSTTQTESLELCTNKSNCSFVQDASYEECKKIGVLGSAASIFKPTFIVENTDNNGDWTVSKPCAFHVPSKRSTPRSNCYCSYNPKLTSESTREIQILVNFEYELNKLNQDRSRSSNDSTNLSSIISPADTKCELLAELCSFVASSRSACIILINCIELRTNETYSSHGLLSSIVSCSAPCFDNNNHVINRDAIKLCLRVLNVICEHCDKCCCAKMFTNVLHALKFKKIVDGSCGFETAFLGISLLKHLSRVKTLFSHSDGTCLILSVSKLLRHCFCSGKLLKQQQCACFFTCVNLLSNVVALHGVSAFNCNCLSSILDEAFTWIRQKDVNDKEVLLEMFGFIRTLYKFIEDETCAVLCSRMSDKLISVLSRICHSKDFNELPVRDIILELWERENFAPKMKTDLSMPSTSKK